MEVSELNILCKQKSPIAVLRLDSPSMQSARKPATGSNRHSPDRIVTSMDHACETMLCS
jgi:hypothetical protein